MEQTLQRHESKRELKNNDPLAHVYLLQDSYDGAIADHRMHTEFVTDMGERLENQPFRSTFQFRVREDEIIYDTGLEFIASLHKSCIAAEKDVAIGTFSDYHVARQEAFMRQGVKVLEWANDPKIQSHVIAFSLCPPGSEVSIAEAKKQSFKPDRMMASIQVHTKNNGFGETIAFSLDGLTIARLQLLLDRLGLSESVSATTLEQLGALIHLDNSESAEASVDKIIRLYDEICQEQDGFLYQQGINIEKNTVEANDFVVAHPEAYKLYKSVVQGVAESLNSRVTRNLSQTVRQQLAIHYYTQQPPQFLLLSEGDYLDERLAASLIEYLRRKAIPEYLTKQLLEQKRAGDTVANAAAYDIGSAGVEATLAGREYSSACPTSGSAVLSAEAALQEQASLLGINKTAVVYELPSPVLSKGEFDVIPIGSCPMCKAECGTGIRNRRSGEWFCTQKKCTAYEEHVYNFVFGITNVEGSQKAVKDSEPKTKNYSRLDEDNSRYAKTEQIQSVQNRLWLLKNELYDNTEITDIERTDLIVELVAVYAIFNSLLRADNVTDARRPQSEFALVA